MLFRSDPVAKRRGLPYLPGSRDGVVKVKPYRTADCVIVGFRWSDKADRRISTLLLGLYDENGKLDFVGHTSGFPAPAREELERNRFRHGTRFLRFRPDKDPKQCTWREVRPPRRRDDLTVPQLLAG